MPYYCTVPRCTSMAGKAKNVSFHQFPRDEELAKLWNEILKRGKPYTKYSKVCSLHFTAEDYTITSVGKNKGQWRTLRKDAIPSQNLPSESPTPYQRKQWSGYQTPAVMDPSIQQQMAQAIYMQTMLAMQTSSAEMLNNGPLQNQPHTSTDSEILKGKETNTEKTYKCTDCSKCFKDPDVYILHKRSHIKHEKNEKENFNMNVTLQANPILANLLKTNNGNVFDSTLTMENLLMSALVNIREGYMRNLTSLIKNDGLNHADRLINDRDIDQDGFSQNNEIDSDKNGADSVNNQSNKTDLSASTLGHQNSTLSYNGFVHYQNGLDNNESDSDSEYQSHNYRKISDGVNRYELNNRSSDNESDSKMYKCKVRYNGFDIDHNDSSAKDSVAINSQICDSDLNESVDSDNLVIDETA